MTCIFQSGASYQTSPTRRSILPSLLTSATATPSERNVLSRTVFFQVILNLPGFGAAAPPGASPAGSAGKGRKTATNSHERQLMVASLNEGLCRLLESSN